MTPQSAVPWLQITAFTLISYALAWTVALPLWRGDGLESPLFLPLSVAMMATPTAAALIVLFRRKQRHSRARALGLVPVKPVGRLVGYLGLGLVLPIALSFVALVVGQLFGVFHADFNKFSGFEQVTRAQLLAAGVTELPLPIGAMVALQFVNVIFAALVINLLPALAEEIGWRGWLLPRLLPLGPVPAIVTSGAIWGLWHAPLILLGYNYPGTPAPLALLTMIGFCIVMGGLFGWLRLRSQSVWPAALAHSSLNASATLYILFFAQGTTFNPLHANITGWSGWIVPLLLLAVIVTTSRFRAVPTVMPETE